MSKKLYSLPLTKVIDFLNQNKSTINTTLKEKKNLEIALYFGKCYYGLALEEFIRFFKIYKDTTYTLKTIEFFNSEIFLMEIAKLLSLNEHQYSQNLKSMVFAVSYLLCTKNKPLFEDFFKSAFLHFHTSFQKDSDIYINHEQIVKELVKSKRQIIKESFGQSDDDVFFKISLDGNEIISLKGKSLKTLRKKAYKNFFFYFLDHNF